MTLSLSLSLSRSLSPSGSVPAWIWSKAWPKVSLSLSLSLSEWGTRTSGTRVGRPVTSAEESGGIFDADYRIVADSDVYQVMESHTLLRKQKDGHEYMIGSKDIAMVCM